MQDSQRSTGFILSIALHAALVALAMMNLSSVLKVDMDKPMYSVDLVSLTPSEDPAAGDTGEPAPGPPELAEGPKPDESAAAAAIPPPPAPAKPEKAKPEPKIDDAKAISEKKVEEKKKPEKKEEKAPEPPKPTKPEEKKLSREELLKQALQDVKQDVAHDAKSAAAKAAEAKKQQVAGELAALRKSTGGNIFSAGGTGAGGAGGGKGTGAGGAGTGLMSVYGDIVKQVIKKNWRYPAFGTETNVAVVLEINIDQQGKITGSRVLTPSGKPDFDDSALRAVHETQTLPPPRTRSLDTLRITFNLQELRK